MSKKTTFALIALGVLNLAATATAIGAMAFGAKKTKEEIDEVRTKTNKTLGKFKALLSEIDI